VLGEGDVLGDGLGDGDALGLDDEVETCCSSLSSLSFESSSLPFAQVKSAWIWSYAVLRIALSVVSATTTSAESVALGPCPFARSRALWYFAYAPFTSWSAAAIVCAWSEQLVEADEVDEELLGLAEAVSVGDGVADAVSVGEGLAERAGLAFGVTVIVVTPFSTVAVMSAPVVPMRKTAATAPLFALSNSSRSFSSM
jgi:hypothetical protein